MDKISLMEKPLMPLSQKLKLVANVFDTNKITNLQPDKKYIQKYYKVNKLAYSLFHTRSDRMYMGVSRDGKLKEEDLLEGARTVERFIKKGKTKKILELASGRGATSSYLAKKFPDIAIHGIELSKGQLDFAKKKAKKLPNFKPAYGDYHDLSNYKDKGIDIVYVIEALCYSRNKQDVLAEVKRVLKPGGVFIILDAYSVKNRDELTKSELLASKLTEKSMAVPEFENYNKFMSNIKKSSFKVESDDEVSAYIMPTLKKFERLSLIFFNRPGLAKLIVKILPKEFTYNAVAGLLMPNLINGTIASYNITVLRKP